MPQDRRDVLNSRFHYMNRVLPSIGISIAILLVMSFAMTWVTMPLLTRLARRWPYPTK